MPVRDPDPAVICCPSGLELHREMRTLDASYHRCIRTRAESLAAAHPEDAALILGYVDAQQRAARAWERNALSAAWLLRRA